MTPDGPWALEALLSGDRSRIREAVGAITASSDRAMLDHLLPHLDAVRADVAGRVFPPGILSMSQIVERALRWIEVNAQPGCSCGFYLGDILTDPRNEERLGRVRIEGSTVDREAYVGHYRVCCLGCDTVYEVTEELGWHMPTYRWARTRRPPAPTGPLGAELQSVIDDLDSGDRSRVEAALGMLDQRSDRESLLQLAAHLTTITIGLSRIDWEGQRSDQYRADFQLARLAAIAGEGCDCTALPGIWKGRPNLAHEVDRGRMEPVGEGRGRCHRCGTVYRVEEEPARDFPYIATWTQDRS